MILSINRTHGLLMTVTKPQVGRNTRICIIYAVHEKSNIRYLINQTKYGKKVSMFKCDPVLTHNENIFFTTHNQNNSQTPCIIKFLGTQDCINPINTVFSSSNRSYRPRSATLSAKSYMMLTLGRHRNHAHYAKIIEKEQNFITESEEFV